MEGNGISMVPIDGSLRGFPGKLSALGYGIERLWFDHDGPLTFVLGTVQGLDRGEIHCTTDTQPKRAIMEKFDEAHRKKEAKMKCIKKKSNTEGNEQSMNQQNSVQTSTDSWTHSQHVHILAKQSGNSKRAGMSY